MVFFISSKIILLFPFLPALCMNDQRNKLQDLLKKRIRNFFKNTQSKRKKFLYYLLHTIVVDLANANCSVALLPLLSIAITICHRPSSIIIVVSRHPSSIAIHHSGICCCSLSFVTILSMLSFVTICHSFIQGPSAFIQCLSTFAHSVLSF